MGSKCRTDLEIRPPEAKFLEELDFDVKKSLAPRKSAENNEKPKQKSEILAEKNFSTSKNRKLQIVRNARCRSFVAIGAMFEG